jgi:hypothetical protein
VPEPEAPGRLAKQFDLLARALAVVRQEPAVSLTDYSTVVQVANDTLPTTRQTMLQATPRHPQFVDVRPRVRVNNRHRHHHRLPDEQREALSRRVDRGQTGQSDIGGARKADLWSPSENLLELLDEIRPTAD